MIEEGIYRNMVTPMSRFTSTPVTLWDEASAGYEDVSYNGAKGHYPANKFRSRLLLNFFEGLPNKKARVLDAGCGTGQMTRELLKRGWDATSIDYSPGMIKTATTAATKAGLQGKFQVLSLYELAKLNQKFDVIMLNGVLPYIAPEDETKVFEQLRKVSHDRTYLLSAHYNLYFSLLALDNWTTEAIADQLLANFKLPDTVRDQARAKISSRLSSPAETLDQERTMKTENPLTYEQKLAGLGFKQFDLAYYNFFYLPAAFQEEQDQSIRDQMEMLLNRDPRALTFARAFVSFAQRQG